MNKKKGRREEERREGRTNLELSVDTLLMEVMVTRFECSYLFSRLELTHTHHTTEDKELIKSAKEHSNDV